MSSKQSTFASTFITNPLNTHNFLVKMDWLGDVAQIVQAAKFPSEKSREIKLWFQGEPIRYEGIPELGGTWAFKIPENDNGKIFKLYRDFKGKSWDQKEGILNPQKTFDVTVKARNLKDKEIFSVVLKDCWIQSHEDVSLTNSNPEENWKWDFVLVYQSIRETV